MEPPGTDPPLSLTFALSEIRPQEVGDLVRPWAPRAGLLEKSAQRYLSALEELSDAVASLSRDLRLSGNFSVQVEPFAGWITTRVSYPGGVPLDPRFDVRDEMLQEFPGVAVQPDIFWRRLILEWVDKAQWSRHGGTVNVALSQYARRPSSPAELYFLGLTPKPVPGLELREPQGGVTLALVPTLQSAFRLDQRARFLLETADGKTPVREIYRAYVRRFGLVHPSVLGELVEDCARKGLLVAGEPLVRKIEKTRPGSWFLRLGTLRFSVPKPDALFSFLDRWTGWFWSEPCLWVVLSFVLLSLSLFGWQVAHQQGLVRTFLPPPTPGQVPWPLLALAGPFVSLLYAGTWVFHHDLTKNLTGGGGLPIVSFLCFLFGVYASTLVHELSHGMACKRQGGRLREFGVIFYYGMLCPYVDTTEAWMLPRRTQRALISFAGPLANLTMGCLCLWGEAIALEWDWPAAVQVLGALAFVSLAIAALNLLPILQLDGYYILSDLLDRPNLKQNAKAYWAALLRGAPPAVKGWEKALFVMYGLGSATLILLLVASPLVAVTRSVGSGRMSPLALLSSLSALLLVVQAVAQVAAEWYRHGMQEAIDLKGMPLADRSPREVVP